MMKYKRSETCKKKAKEIRFVWKFSEKFPKEYTANSGSVAIWSLRIESRNFLKFPFKRLLA